MWANIDDGAMKEVMSLETFNKVKHRLGTASPSSQLLHMANGAVVRSETRWEGRIEVNGVQANITFEVFDSGGKWDFLFGKKLLETYKAVHDYMKDEITLHGEGKQVTISNQAHMVEQWKPHTKSPAPICVVTEQQDLETDDKFLKVETDGLKDNAELYIRMTQPFKQE